jgi:DNA-binding XRE family transcriptional regulator
MNQIIERVEGKTAVLKLREKLGESQTSFGKRFDLAQRTIANYETGVSCPKIKVAVLMRELARELDLDFELENFMSRE